MERITKNTKSRATINSALRSRNVFKTIYKMIIKSVAQYSELWITNRKEKEMLKVWEKEDQK